MTKVLFSSFFFDKTIHLHDNHPFYDKIIITIITTTNNNKNSFLIIHSFIHSFKKKKKKKKKGTYDGEIVACKTMTIRKRNFKRLRREITHISFGLLLLFYYFYYYYYYYSCCCCCCCCYYYSYYSYYYFYYFFFSFSSFFFFLSSLFSFFSLCYFLFIFPLSRNLKHPNIVSFYGMKVIGVNGYFFFLFFLSPSLYGHSLSNFFFFFWAKF